MEQVLPAARSQGAARPARPRGLPALTRAAAIVLGLALGTAALALTATAATAAPAAPPVTAPAVPALPSSPGAPAAATTGPADLLQQLTGGTTDGSGNRSLTSNPVGLVVLLGLVSVVPALLIMVTAFTRIVIVLGFTRSALGTNGIPPNQVLIGLAMFLTFFVMAPAFSQANKEGIQPYLHEGMSQSQAFEKTLEPFRGFMLKQVRDKDLGLFMGLAHERADKREDVSTTTLIPAFVISELRAAFLIGFVIFIPFIVIDLVVSAVLSALGMVMLPPALISLPFKLLLFVAADGWFLLAKSLVTSFHTA